MNDVAIDRLIAMFLVFEANQRSLSIRIARIEDKLAAEIRELTAERNHLLAQLAHQDDDD